MLYIITFTENENKSNLKCRYDLVIVVLLSSYRIYLAYSDTRSQNMM